MTLAIFGMAGPALSADERAFFRDADPAGYILFGRNIENRAQLRGLTDDLRAALGLLIGGIPAVLLAAFIVKQLPLFWLRWLVVIVTVYAAVLMLRGAFAERTVVPRGGTEPL